VSALLALTDSAVEAVKHIVSSSEEASETGGLRLVAEQVGTQTNFQLSVVPLPAEDDEVIEEQDARVFLEPEAASLLDDKVLDATVEQSKVAFTIADQAEALAAGAGSRLLGAVLLPARRLGPGRPRARRGAARDRLADDARHRLARPARRSNPRRELLLRD
jgi:iron-sulfur cluster assembly protein